MKLHYEFIQANARRQSFIVFKSNFRICEHLGRGFGASPVEFCWARYRWAAMTLSRRPAVPLADKHRLRSQLCRELQAE